MTQIGVHTLAPAEVERPGEVMPASVPPGRSPIRPSEALRLGSLTTEQWFGSAYGPDGQLCATATIYEFAGTIMPLEELRHVQCPACGGNWNEGGFFITVHLNDYHRWTRLQIADWLASINL